MIHYGGVAVQAGLERSMVRICVQEVTQVIVNNRHSIYTLYVILLFLYRMSNKLLAKYLQLKLFIIELFAALFLCYLFLNFDQVFIFLVMLVSIDPFEGLTDITKVETHTVQGKWH